MPATETHQMEIDLGEGDEERAEEGQWQEGFKDWKQAVARLIQSRCEGKRQIQRRPHKDGDRECPVLQKGREIHRERTGIARFERVMT